MRAAKELRTLIDEAPNDPGGWARDSAHDELTIAMNTIRRLYERGN